MDPVKFSIYKSAIEMKQATKPCSRCGHTQFNIIDETVLSIQNQSSFVIGGPGVPVVMVGCAKCGCISLHAKTILAPGAQ